MPEARGSRENAGGKIILEPSRPSKKLRACGGLEIRGSWRGLILNVYGPQIQRGNGIKGVLVIHRKK